MAVILIVEDEAPLRQSAAIALRREGHEVEQAGTVREAAEALRKSLFELVIVDLRLPDGDGLAVLEDLRTTQPEASALMVSAYGSVEVAVEAMRLGAFDFVEKPFGPERLSATVARALEHRRMRAELERRGARSAIGLIGTSSAIDEVRRRVEQSAEARIVLVTGETGTGKERVARAVHARRDPASSLVVVHCGSLPTTMIESELFGHVQGAFVGAEGRRGLLREADGGTVFLDEVAEVPLELQPRLLRFLEDGQVRPVGADRASKVDAQVVAATARDLGAEVKAGRFRQDLLYRLDVFRIHLPPLRERKEDIEPLCRHFLAELCERMQRAPVELEPDVLEALQRYDWPGNVRELRHTLERALLLCDEPVLPLELVEPLSDEDEPEEAGAVLPDREGSEGAVDLRPLAAVEREHILRVLAACDGDRTKSARKLGISRSTLRRKLIAYDLWGRRRRNDADDEDGSK